MTHDELQAIGVRCFLADASLKNLTVEHEFRLARWDLAMALITAETENKNRDLIEALGKAYQDWNECGIVPVWDNLLDLIE